MVALIFLTCCVILWIAYRTYGGFLERQMRIDPNRPTPAIEFADGVDYVSADNPVLFGHHFSSIAGAGPIVGPIIAGLAFGWLPALLWIMIGAILVGGVHDYTALMASIRHKGRTIGQVCRDYLSPMTYNLFLIFIWFALVYVIIVFLDLTATTFSPAPAGTVPPDQAAAIAARGGAVATSSLLYIAIAMVFGLSVYKFKVPFRVASWIFVPLVFVGLWVGGMLPLMGDRVPEFLGSSKNFWSLLLLIYCYAASITPVWILLQPRDYLSSFLLFACLAGGAVGLLIGGVNGSLPLQYSAYRGFVDSEFHLGPLFPALFITIACGAVSGFHSVVASGTTSKQLRDEGSAKPIAYGSMLVEAGLAVVALSAVMILSKPSGQTPIAVFAAGIGKFFATFGFPEQAATTFGLLAVSTFLLTTLDTCTRLARFVCQELFKLEGLGGRLIATTGSLLLPAFLVFTEIPGPDGVKMAAWKAIWPVFGASNQLLAALELLVVYAWLRQEGRKATYVLIPMAFMSVTTVCALVMLTHKNLILGGSMLIGVISLLLAILAVVVMLDSFLHLRRTPAGVSTVTPTG
ncbi:MAG: carbon starvation protein A [Verrucomicrobia bacterium]|nr:carbon starvation protein A [Verrucomicrobiota bacterium]